MPPGAGKRESIERTETRRGVRPGNPALADIQEPSTSSDECL